MLLLRQLLRLDRCMPFPPPLVCVLAVLYMRNALFSTLLPFVLHEELLKAVHAHRFGLVCSCGLSPTAGLGTMIVVEALSRQ